MDESRAGHISLSLSSGEGRISYGADPRGHGAAFECVGCMCIGWGENDENYMRRARISQNVKSKILSQRTAYLAHNVCTWIQY